LLAEDLREFFYVLGQVVVVQNALAAAGSEATAQGFVVDEAGQGFGQRNHIGGGNEEAVHFSADQLGNSSDAGGNGGNFHGHGFHEDHWQAFGKAGQAEGVSACVERADAILIHGAFEEHRFRSGAARGAFPQRDLVRSAAHKTETYVLPLPGEPVDGVDEKVLSLCRCESADAEYFEDVGGSLLCGRNEEVWVYPERHDVKFGPVPIGRQVHQLAAGEGTDADDEVGGGYFLGERLAVGIVKLVGSMDGQGESVGEDGRNIQSDAGCLGGEMNMKVGLSNAAHPLADHQGFSEVHGLEKEARKAEAGKAEDAGKAAEIASRTRQEGARVRGERAGNAVTLDAVCVGGFVALVGCKLLGRTVGWVDGSGFDTKAESAQGEDLTQDKDHGKSGVTADQVGH